MHIESVGQCLEIAVEDFSFEEGTFAEGNQWMEKGYWYANDGVYISGEY